MKLQRQVLPERLDVMAVADPAARRARRDLQRVHRVMRSLSILRDAIDSLQMARPPRNILELGAGDGSLMLRFARSSHTAWRDVRVTFLDRQDVVDPETCQRFKQLGWDAQLLRMDALDWAQAPAEEHYDLGV
ncbi:MAG: class I SAM-dependent methyltransferase, partial [Sinobacteraceae bacterium]|nr:class I SAM-dependent methyltransferase [Nevskiaceae bacterium]